MINFDLNNHLNKQAGILAFKCNEKNIEFIVDFKFEPEKMVIGDPGRLCQIITNLVGNAFKFTEKGEIVIGSDLVEENETSYTVKFSVSDTGIGIPKNKQKNLFNKFTQADSSINKKYGGTGLGLAISKQLAKLMGGDIQVLSEEGEGATFWFTAKLGKTEQALINNFDSEILKGLRAIIVDDNSTNLIIMEEMLNNWDIETVTTTNPQEAIELLTNANMNSEGKFDILLTDMNMPEMSGESLCKIIRHNKIFKDLKIVVCTSIYFSDNLRRFKRNYINGYILKPIRRDDIYNILVNLYSDEISSFKAVDKLVGQFLDSRILIVEDNIINQKVAVGMLDKYGITPDIACDGKEAVEFVKKNNYDLIFMDLQMPNMNGYEATKAIRSFTDIAKKKIIIIAMTAQAYKKDAEMSIAAGMNDYLTKPIKVDELFNALKKWIPEKYTLQRENKIKAFCKETLMEYCDNDKDIAVDILNTSLEDLPLQISNLEESLTNNNFEAVKRHAHSIKGVTSYLGAVEVNKLSSYIEKTADSEDNTSITKILNKLLPSYIQLEKEMKAAVKDLENN